MCGISGLIGRNWEKKQLEKMIRVQSHRGPDDNGMYIDAENGVGLGHNRLSIIDLSSDGHQPMCNYNKKIWVVFNGEIYNYLELRSKLKSYPYKSNTDTEVILAAYEKWGEKCVDHFIGMFSFAIWDKEKRKLFAARDRFGVKPFYYTSLPGGDIAFASEIKALHKIGVPREPDAIAWANYLTYGLYDCRARTFWENVTVLLPGHALCWQDSNLTIRKWYDLADLAKVDLDHRAYSEVMDEYRSILEENVRLRFRSDVPVGINLSGGLDSSILLGLVDTIKENESNVSAFTFYTGHEKYDELPWVKKMLAETSHPHYSCLLEPSDVPDLAANIQFHEDEPFGGLPTLAYSKLFERANQLQIPVLLDGQGMDEQWAGYEYYGRASNHSFPIPNQSEVGPVQGSRMPSVRPECLTKEFRDKAELFKPPSPFPDGLRNLQYRDASFTKIPRALRFNDRISMMYSIELREPFLDHRLFELAFRQPKKFKIQNGTHKWLLRKIARDLLPAGIIEAPKRPLQTPQREWLRNELKNWVNDCIEKALSVYGGSWLISNVVRNEWREFQENDIDNSFFIWQWINLGLSLS